MATRKCSFSRTFKTLVLLAGVWLVAPAFVWAEYQAEIMEAEGSVTLVSASGAAKDLKEGDLVQEGDTLRVLAGSHADVTFDGDWENVSRIEENSEVKIASLYPVKLNLAKGGVYSKLNKLPQGSSFEVQTPTALATVRGTEYRAVYQDGKSEVFNFSDSPVYVYGVEEGGSLQPMPVLVLNSQKTSVDRRGAPPIKPLQMKPNEMMAGQRLGERLHQVVRQRVDQGRHARIQDVKQVEERMKRGPEDRDGKPGDERRQEPGRGMERSGGDGMRRFRQEGPDGQGLRGEKTPDPEMGDRRPEAAEMRKPEERGVNGDRQDGRPIEEKSGQNRRLKPRRPAGAPQGMQGPPR